jgi:hypothetical protein
MIADAEDLVRLSQAQSPGGSILAARALGAANSAVWVWGPDEEVVTTAMAADLLEIINMVVRSEGMTGRGYRIAINSSGISFGVAPALRGEAWINSPLLRDSLRDKLNERLRGGVFRGRRKIPRRNRDFAMIFTAPNFQNVYSGHPAL